jgi:hypothetical protein
MGARFGLTPSLLTTMASTLMIRFMQADTEERSF